MSISVSAAARLISASDGNHILEVAGRPLLKLTPVAAIIWRELTAGIDVREIVRQIANRFDVSEARATRDVASFIRELKYLLLVSEQSDVKT